MQGPADPQRGTGTGPAAAQCRPENRCTGDKGARGAGRGAGRALAKAGHSKTLYFTLVPFGIAVSSTSRQRMLQATRSTEMDCNTKMRVSLSGRCGAPGPGSTSQAAHPGAHRRPRTPRREREAAGTPHTARAGALRKRRRKGPASHQASPEQENPDDTHPLPGRPHPPRTRRPQCDRRSKR